MKRIVFLLILACAIFAQDFEFVGSIKSGLDERIIHHDDQYFYSVISNELVVTDYSDLRNLEQVARAEYTKCPTAYLSFDLRNYHYNSNLYFALDSPPYNYIYSFDISDPHNPVLNDSLAMHFGDPHFYSFTDSTTHIIDFPYSTKFHITDLSDLSQSDTIDYGSRFNIADFICTSEDTVQVMIYNYNSILSQKAVSTEFVGNLDTLFTCDSLPQFKIYRSDSTYKVIFSNKREYDDFDSLRLIFGNITSDSIEIYDSLEMQVNNNYIYSYFNYQDSSFLAISDQLINITNSPYFVDITTDSSSILYPYYVFSNDSSFTKIYLNSYFYNFEQYTSYTEKDTFSCVASYPRCIIQGFKPFLTNDSLFMCFVFNKFNEEEYLMTYSIEDDSIIKFNNYVEDLTHLLYSFCDDFYPTDTLLFASNNSYGISVYKYIGHYDYEFIGEISGFERVQEFVVKPSLDNNYYLTITSYDSTTYEESYFIVKYLSDGSYSIIAEVPFELRNIYQTADSTIYISAWDTLTIEEENIHIIYGNFSDKIIDIDDSTFYYTYWQYLIPVPHRSYCDSIYLGYIEGELYISPEGNKYIIDFCYNKYYIIDDSYTLHERDFELNEDAYSIDPYGYFCSMSCFGTICGEYLFARWRYDGDFYRNDILQVYHIPSEILVDYEISEGWNMLSYPFNGKSVSDGLFPFAVGPIYNYDPETGYIPADTITCNHGFWLLSDRDTTVSFSSLATAQFYEDTLKRGFNLIGMPGTPLPATAILDYPHTIGGAYEYVPSLRTYTEPDTLTPTKGYWIFADSIVPYRLGEF